jgi:uncharacterized protein
MVIDAHIHVQPWKQLRPGAHERLSRGRSDLDLIRRLFDDPSAFLRYLDEQGIDRAVLVNYVSPDVIGFTDDVNEWIGRYCRGHEDRLIAVGGVHPRLTPDPAGALRHIVEAHGISVLKLHPPHQHFHPNDYRDGGGLPGLASLYERAQSLGIPVMVHTGTSVFPEARNKYGDPMTLDDVAVDFPKLTLVLAHGGRPLWMETCFFLLRRHPNLYMDISGIPPKALLRYFPRIEEIAHKTMFGTDWPSPGVESPGANLEALRALPIRADALEAILGGTAARVFARR